jgi:NAD+ synthase (glutamine-hydrolysing)
MQIHLHQTHHTIADFPAIFQTLKSSLQRTGIHLFPELFLTGYPLNDLCLNASFIQHYQRLLQDINLWSQALPADPDQAMLLGGLDYHLGAEGIPLDIYNVIYELRPGSPLKAIYRKRLLPNYDIFDEQKYFTAGEKAGVWEFQGEKYGLLICEDMWASSFHHLDPARELAQHGVLRAVFNLSASPFDIYKADKRKSRAKALSNLLKAPFYYVNRVGAEDEIIFDGSSFAVNGHEVLATAPRFQAHTLSLPLAVQSQYLPSGDDLEENTWESLFQAQFSADKVLPRRLRIWDNDECQLILEALKFSLQEYAKKNGFQKFLVALSGGLDSSLVLTIVKMSLQPGQEVEALYMPGNFSSSMSWDLSSQLCQNLGVKLTSLPIKFLHSNIKMNFQTTFGEDFVGLTDENVQSRLRGLLLYTRSNQTGALVLNTSNKSELAVGYSTQYGDSVGALSLLGDLYKSETYRLAEWINQKFSNTIPVGIIQRAPTAELRANQKDEDSLPPYERLDAMLEGILSFRYRHEDLLSMGFSQEEVKRVFELYYKSEYKRRQFCPIIKIKSKSFGFGYRVPLCKNTGFYAPLT